MEPIALIPELTTTLTKVSKGLAPWDRLVRLEEQLLRRARAAFLVHWFGTSVPVKHLNLFIAIRNIGALRDRFERVRASARTAPTGMSLMGPLTGMAGVVVGYVLSPGGAALVGYWMTELSDVIKDREWTQWIILFFSGIANWVSNLLVLPVIGAIAIPVGLLWSLGLGIGGDRTTALVVDLMHDLAAMLDAGLTLWDQISGPRDEVNNPLLRSLLDFLDRSAGFFAHLLGFVAILAVRVLPLVPYLMTQFRAFWDLTMTLKDTLSDAVGGIAEALLTPFLAGGGIVGILTHVYDMILTIPDILMDGLKGLMDTITTEMTTLYDSMKSALDDYIDTVKDRIQDAFNASILGQLVTLATDLMALLPRVISRIQLTYNTPGPDDTDEGEEDLATTLRGMWYLGVAFDTHTEAADLLDEIDALTVPELPDFTLPDMPQVPTLPDGKVIAQRIGRAPEIAWGAHITALFERARAEMPNAHQPARILRRPRSVLDAERRAHEARGAPSRTDADMRLRAALYLAVGRVLPGDLRVYAPQLRSFFDMIDHQIYAQPEAQPLAHPQLDLPDSGRLQPRVNKLVIRARGAVQAPDMRAFRDSVVSHLQSQSYRVQGAGAE